MFERPNPHVQLVVVIQVSTIVTVCMLKGTPLSHHSSSHEHIPALSRCDGIELHIVSYTFRRLSLPSLNLSRPSQNPTLCCDIALFMISYRKRKKTKQ